MDGDVKGSRELQLRALPLIEKLFCEVNPIPVKAAMNMLGWEVGPLRMPLSEMEEEHQKELKAAMYCRVATALPSGWMQSSLNLPESK